MNKLCYQSFNLFIASCSYSVFLISSTPPIAIWWFKNISFLSRSSLKYLVYKNLRLPSYKFKFTLKSAKNKIKRTKENRGNIFLWSRSLLWIWIATFLPSPDPDHNFLWAVYTEYDDDKDKHHLTYSLILKTKTHTQNQVLTPYIIS